MRHSRGEDGVLAVETAVIAPAVLVLLLLVIYVARAVGADTQVQTAAARAARAASLEANAAAAIEAASGAAEANLGGAGIACTDIHIEVDTDHFGAGNIVAVTVGCQITNTDLALLAVPGTRWSSARAVHVVDRYRGGG